MSSAQHCSCRHDMPISSPATFSTSTAVVRSSDLFHPPNFTIRISLPFRALCQENLSMSTPESSAQPRIFPRFEGKTVLVTGEGTGLRAEIAFRAAQEGARVGVHYNRSKDGAEKTAERIRSIGGDAFIVQADISSWDAIKK